MKLVLGASGRLGTGLCTELAARGVLAPSRSAYQNWWRPDAVPEITRYLSEQGSCIEVVFVAAGIIDPAASAADHERVNYLLPQQVIRAASLLGIRVITFGTMLETISTNIPVGGYVASKAALARVVEELAREGRQALHLRIHTLYGGGPPDPFMFTGQMLTALRKRQPFLMSPGTQLREYHHIDDEAPAVVTLAESGACGVVELNHGDPISLAEIAQGTFRALGASDLLKIGALPAPAHEKLGLRFPRPPLLAGHFFRDARVAMVDYIKSYLPDSEVSA